MGVSALALVALATTPHASSAQTDRKQIAVTFDDLPLSMSRVPAAHIREVNRQLLHVLTANRIPAIGFVNESKLDVEGERETRTGALAMWLDADLELGSHSYSHPSLHHTPLAEYQADVKRGAEVTNHLLAERGRGRVRYFRHPYLRTGLTLDIKRAFEAFLTEEGYTVAPVTVENWDWMFSAVYVDAVGRGNAELAERTATAYLRFTEDMFDFFEGVSQQLFGRQIRHTLLLHANELNARCLEAVVDLMRARGYEFVSLTQALEDEAYGLPDNYAGPAGVSWMFRWDYTRGRAVDWRAEPEPPAFVQSAYEATIR